MLFLLFNLFASSAISFSNFILIFYYKVNLCGFKDDIWFCSDYNEDVYYYSEDGEFIGYYYIDNEIGDWIIGRIGISMVLIGSFWIYVNYYNY